MAEVDQNEGILEPLEMESLKPLAVPVPSKDDRIFQLRECSEGDAAVYRDMQMKAMKMNPDGNVMANDGQAESESFLVSCCLWEQDKQTGTWARVKLTTVRSWPHRVVAPLYERAMKLSKLEEKWSVEFIDKRIAELTKLRERRLKAEGKEGWEKKSPGDTTPSSAEPTP